MSDEFENTTPDFLRKIESLYDDLVYKSTDRRPPAYPGHALVYPSEQDFIAVLQQMCEQLRIKDITAHNEIGISSPEELFPLIEQEGLQRNHAIILAVMLNLSEAGAERFVLESSKDYFIKHGISSETNNNSEAKKQRLQWHVERPRITYGQARELLEEKKGNKLPPVVTNEVEAVYLAINGVSQSTEDIPEKEAQPAGQSTTPKKLNTNITAVATQTPDNIEKQSEIDKPVADTAINQKSSNLKSVKPKRPMVSNPVAGEGSGLLKDLVPLHKLPVKTPNASKIREQPISSISDDEMRAGQLHAIEQARTEFSEQKIYDENKNAEIATRLFIALVNHSPLGTGYKAKNLADAVGAEISVSSFDKWYRAKISVNAESLGITGVVDTLVPKLVLDEQHREEVANYLLSIPIVKMEHPAQELLHYIVDHGGNSADYLYKMRHQKRINADGFSESLNINRTALGRLSRGECKRVLGEVDIITSASDGLGLDAADALIFRKLVLQLPQDVTQETLNQCFTKPAEIAVIDADAQPKKSYWVDSDATEARDRTVALSRFLELLCIARGKRDIPELAQSIAVSNKLAETVGKQLESAMHNIAVGGAFDAEQEEKIIGKRGKALKKPIAEMVAAYAFPDDEKLHDQCMTFLSSEKKYYTDYALARQSSSWVLQQENETLTRGESIARP